MSTTVQGIDARAYLSGWASALTGMYAADVKATPDESWNATFGGCTRPASALTADALSMMVWCTEVMKGNEADHMALMGQLSEELTSKEAAVAKLQEATANFCAALNAASDELLNSVVIPAWQMPTPLFTLAHIAVSHLWYHDGQLNYIQCLLGDEKVHWMGD